MSQQADKRQTQESGGLGLLDFLFTVAIGLGLTPELLEADHLKGVLSENWVKQQMPPSVNDWFNLLVLLLGLLTTVFSWFGYHRSIIDKPVAYDTLRGMARFTTDVVLIIVYGLMMIFFKSFSLALLLLVLVFWLYAAWDLIRAWEYSSSYAEAPKLLGVPRYELIPIPWAIVVTVALVGVHVFPTNEPWPALGVAAVAVFGFRFHKRWARREQRGLGR